MKKTTAIRMVLIMAVLASACSVQDFSCRQSICNFTKKPLLYTSYDAAAEGDSSHKVHVVLGLFAWGDASIHSTADLGNGFKIQKFRSIEEKRRLFLGCGYYTIVMRGGTH